MKTSDDTKPYLTLVVCFAIVCLVAFLLPSRSAHAAVPGDPAAFGRYGHVAVLASAATKIPDTPTNSRNAVALFNNGPNTIYCGFDTSVTTSNGFPIPSATMLAMDVRGGATGNAVVYCIAATADQSGAADTRWIEVR